MNRVKWVASESILAVSKYSIYVAALNYQAVTNGPSLNKTYQIDIIVWAQWHSRRPLQFLDTKCVILLTDNLSSSTWLWTWTAFRPN
jgi:hypothetical protein